MDHCLGGIGIGVIVLLYIRSGVVVKVLFGIAMLGTRANLPIEERGCLSAVVASLIIIIQVLCGFFVVADGALKAPQLAESPDLLRSFEGSPNGEHGAAISVLLHHLVY